MVSWLECLGRAMVCWVSPKLFDQDAATPARQCGWLFKEYYNLIIMVLDVRLQP